MDRSGPRAGYSGVDELVNSLAHYGVKGMQWGVRRKSDSGATAVRDRRGGLIKPIDAEGKEFKNQKGDKLSSDAVRARFNQGVAKKAGTDVLSTKDLQELVTRLNLEQQYDRLNPKTKSSERQLAEKLLKIVGPVAVQTIGPKVVSALPEPYAAMGKVGIQVAGAMAGQGQKKKK